MALFDDAGTITNLVRPGQTLATGDINAQAIEQYSAEVESSVERKSVLDGHIPMKRVVGTNTLTDFAVGESTLGVVTPGVAPEGTQTKFSKASITVDTVILARATLPLLEVFQTSYDARTEIGREHGKKIAKFRDQSMFIQAAKAASLATSRFAKPAELDGFDGGSVHTMAAVGDKTDPAKLYQAIRELFVKMEDKDVTPGEDDVMLAMRPDIFYALMDAEQIVNGTYVTADGTSKEGMIFKAFGCPVVRSNNVPNTAVTGHFLSNAANSNAYDGDFTKLVALAFSPRALLGGETIPLTSDVWYNKEYKTHFVDSHLSYAVTPNRAEYAGAIWLP